MLTKKENLIETLKGGNPDRFVKQFEAFEIFMSDPMRKASGWPVPGGPPVADSWGVLRKWPVGEPGAMPIHNEEATVIKDIEHWRDYVKAPSLDFSSEEWDKSIEAMEAVDREDKFALIFLSPGVFEACHYLLDMQTCLMNFYLAPDKMHELVDFITEYELKMAELICSRLKPDGVYHHDDWGTQISTFISPEMFEEYYLPAYKQIYGYYKSHGAELIVHHSDSYAATLVPHMIDMGVDIWQGVMTTNNIPELVDKYGGKITFMGGIDSASVDRPDWNREIIAAEVRRACTECGPKYFIPCTTMGEPGSFFKGVYDTVSEEIDRINKERSGLI